MTSCKTAKKKGEGEGEEAEEAMNESLSSAWEKG